MPKKNSIDNTISADVMILAERFKGIFTLHSLKKSLHFSHLTKAVDKRAESKFKINTQLTDDNYRE